MRIIGGRDYYDSAMAYGQDEGILFLRNGDTDLTDEEVRNHLHIPNITCDGYVRPKGQKPQRRTIREIYRQYHAQNVFQQGNEEHSFYYAHVVFAGKLYNGICAVVRNRHTFHYERDIFWIWTRADLESYAERYGLEVHEGRTRTVRSTYTTRSRRRGDVLAHAKSYDDYLSPQDLSQTARAAIINKGIALLLLDPFQEIRHHPDVLDRPWRVNQPGLSEVQFAKVLDPYTAFQELSMWVGGVLPQPGPGAAEITDNTVKIQKHGFDVVSSFRKASSGKRR